MNKLTNAIINQNNKVERLEAQVVRLRKQLEQAREPKTVVKVLPPVRMPGPKQDAPFGVFTVPQGYKYLAGFEDRVWAFSTWEQVVEAFWEPSEEGEEPVLDNCKDLATFKTWVGRNQWWRRMFFFVEVQ